MKFSLSLKILVSLVIVAMALLFAKPAQAGDEVTTSAIASWITKTTKDGVSMSQAEKISRTVFQKAQQHLVDPYLITSVIFAESRFNANARSSAGARGLMQVMPRWHKDKIAGRNIHDVNTNIEVGIKILQDCLSKHRDRVTSGLRCYSGGAGSHYESRIMATHRVLKREVVAARFSKEAPIGAVAVYQKPRQWHNEYESNLMSTSLAFKDNPVLSDQKYEKLIVSLSSKP